MSPAQVRSEKLDLRLTPGAKQTLQRAAAIAGIRAMVVHAKDQQTRGFYEHFGFRPSPTDPLHLFVLLKDLQGH